MTTGSLGRVPSAIFCADWGKERQKRAVYVADVSKRVIWRLLADGWSVAAVLEEAKRWASTGPVLATFDVPLGVPETYLQALSKAHSWQQPVCFLDLLKRAPSMPRFFDGTAVASDWSVDRPFFSVPSGKGGLKSYVAVAMRQGVDLYRRVDKMTRAKSPFIKSGIPGSVGSATCALWQEVASGLTPDRAFKVWPFEGDIDGLLASSPVVIAEMYPRAAYATALLDLAPALRAPLAIAKTDARVRFETISSLWVAEWVGRTRRPAGASSRSSSTPSSGRIPLYEQPRSHQRLTDAARHPRLRRMNVHVDNPELERQLSDLAQKSGRATDDLIQDALAGYFEELGTLRSSLDARYDDLKTGRVQLIDGEKAFNALKAKSEERRNRTA